MTKIDSKEIIPGWKLNIVEKSNNVFQFTAINKKGYKSEITESDWNYGYRKCLEYAFDIEQKIGKDRNKLFYDILLRIIDTKKDIKKKYDENVFGSWWIQRNNKRIVLEGRDYVMWIEEKKKKIFRTDWITIETYNHLENIKYSDLETIARKIE